MLCDSYVSVYSHTGSDEFCLNFTTVKLSPEEFPQWRFYVVKSQDPIAVCLAGFPGLS